MVDITEYIKSKREYITIEDLEGKTLQERMVVVLEEGGFRTCKNKEGKTWQQYNLIVEWNKERKELPVNGENAGKLYSDLGKETSAWVGAVIKMEIIGGGKPRLGLSVVSPPGGKPVV